MLPLSDLAPDRIDFDPATLDRYLRGRLPGLEGAIEVQRISGGQSNPTYFLNVGDRRFVLRKQPQGQTLPTAHAVDREFQVMSALAGRNVPVPMMRLLEQDPSVIGSKFYVMDRLDGRVMHQSSLPDMAAEQRSNAYTDLAKVLASLHAVEWEAAGLVNFGRAGGYFERQIARWNKQWQLSKTREIPEIDQLAEWLSRQDVKDDRTTIVHGDYRVGNVMFHTTEAHIVGVLDWELSTLGHPFADLAHCTAMWFITPQEYGGLLGLDLEPLGLPAREAFEEAYLRAAGLTRGLSPFHIVFALFRFAIIFEGIAARAKAGSAASDNAATVGELSVILARRAADFLAHNR
jgi:aminoglycoside phosphotransferase (APT) family kinase protein